VFKVGNIDRFGDPYIPLKPIRDIPGPGYYEKSINSGVLVTGRNQNNLKQQGQSLPVISNINSTSQ
jgi:hypothetical protein